MDKFVTDIYCNVKQTVQVLTIDFGTETSVCSININGGMVYSSETHIQCIGSYLSNIRKQLFKKTKRRIFLSLQI